MQPRAIMWLYVISYITHNIHLSILRHTRQTGRQTDRQTGKRTNTQANTHTCTLYSFSIPKRSASRPLTSGGGALLLRRQRSPTRARRRAQNYGEIAPIAYPAGGMALAHQQSRDDLRFGRTCDNT